MPSSTIRTFVAAVLIVAAIAVFAVMTSFAFARTDTPTPGQSGPPAAPSAPAPTPIASPTPVPTDAADGPIVVVLDTADDNEVSVAIDDASGKVTGASSGAARDGMSVRWGEIVAENVDADTIRLTWSGWPIDEVIRLGISADGDGYDLAFSQKLPYPNTDAMGADRVLVLDFDHSVDATDIRASFAPAG